MVLKSRAEFGQHNRASYGHQTSNPTEDASKVLRKYLARPTVRYSEVDVQLYSGVQIVPKYVFVTACSL